MKVIHEIVEEELFFEVILNESEMNAIDQYNMISGTYKLAGYPLNVGIRMEKNQGVYHATDQRNLEEIDE